MAQKGVGSTLGGRQLHHPGDLHSEPSAEEQALLSARLHCPAANFCIRSPCGGRGVLKTMHGHWGRVPREGPRSPRDPGQLPATPWPCQRWDALRSPWLLDVHVERSRGLQPKHLKSFQASGVTGLWKQGPRSPLSLRPPQACPACWPLPWPDHGAITARGCCSRGAARSSTCVRAPPAAPADLEGLLGPQPAVGGAQGLNGTASPEARAQALGGACPPTATQMFLSHGRSQGRVRRERVQEAPGTGQAVGAGVTATSGTQERQAGREREGAWDTLASFPTSCGVTQPGEPPV